MAVMRLERSLTTESKKGATKGKGWRRYMKAMSFWPVRKADQQFSTPFSPSYPSLKLFFHFLFLSFSSCNTEEDDNNQQAPLKPFEWNYSMICFFILLLWLLLLGSSLCSIPLRIASTGSLRFNSGTAQMLSYCFRRDKSYHSDKISFLLLWLTH